MKNRPKVKMKDSGIEWLGEVPEGWKLKTLKRTFITFNGSTPRSSNPEYWDGDIPWATPDDLGNLQGSILKVTRRMITQEGYASCGVSLVSKGSLVLSTRAPIGHLAVAGMDLCTNQGCRSLVFRDVDDRFFFFYQLLAARTKLESLGQGSTFMELSRDRLTSVYLVSPPISEQHAITAFLDRKTAQIDSLIEKKQRQIELLQEKRAALISHAVTKGLNPKARMKDTGIEWLGEIPGHWEMLRLKFTVNLINQKVDGKENDLLYTGLEHIESWTGKRIGNENDSNDGQASIHKSGDVLLGKLRPYLAKVYAPQANGICTGEFLVLRPSVVLQIFLRDYLLNSDFISLIDSSTYGAKMPRASWDFIGNIATLVPPINEQRAIAAFLDRKTAQIDSLTNKVKKSIDLLREYRTALISAAVTGEIDVRQESKSS